MCPGRDEASPACQAAALFLDLLLPLTTPNRCCYCKQREGRAADARALSSQSARLRGDRDLEGAAGGRSSTHPYKYRLAYIANQRCVLRFDNEAGKGDHKHVGEREIPYRFTDVDSLQSDFWAEVKNRRRGK
jgi:hypothetical protein